MNRLLLTLFVLFNVFIGSFGYSDENKAAYWQTQRKGANFFNKTPTEDWFIAAREMVARTGILSGDALCVRRRLESRFAPCMALHFDSRRKPRRWLSF